MSAEEALLVQMALLIAGEEKLVHRADFLRLSRLLAPGGVLTVASGFIGAVQSRVSPLAQAAETLASRRSVKKVIFRCLEMLTA